MSRRRFLVLVRHPVELIPANIVEVLVSSHQRPEAWVNIERLRRVSKQFLEHRPTDRLGYFSATELEDPHSSLTEARWLGTVVLKTRR